MYISKYPAYYVLLIYITLLEESTKLAVGFEIYCTFKHPDETLNGV